MALKTRFCIKCGKEAKKVIDSKCVECYFAEKGVSIPKKAAVQICKECKAVNWKGVWIHSDYPPEYYLTMDLLSKAKVPEGAEIENIEIKKMGKTGKVEVIISLLNKEFTQIHDVELKINERRCPDCSKRLSEQHEAIIQIRTDKELIKKIIPFSEKYKKNIIKIEDQRRGIDIYMLSKSAARHLAAELRKRFKLKKKESFKAYSWEKTKGKPKYRITISMHL